MILRILMSLLMWLVIYLAGKFGVAFEVNSLLAMSQKGELNLVAIIAAVRLFMSVVFMAALAKLYLAINNQR
jgi:hypothetical protein